MDLLMLLPRRAVPVSVLLAAWLFCAVGSAAAPCVDYAAWEIPVALSFATGTSPKDLTHMDGLLYAACSSGLRIFEETSPGMFTEIGGVSAWSSGRGLAVEDGWAYLSAGLAGLQIADISDPLTPVLVAEVPMQNAGVIDMEGDHVYISIAWGPSGLLIVDVSDPALPDSLGTWNPGDSTSVSSILVEGSLGYFGVQDGLVFADLTDPAAPATLGKLQAGAPVGGVFPHGGLVYVAADTDGLLIVDAADPAAPAVVGSLTLPESVRRVTVVGDRAYMAGWSGVWVLDVSDPSDPRYLGWVEVGQALDVITVGSNVVAGVIGVAYHGDLASFPTAGLEWLPDPGVIGVGSVTAMEEEGDHLYLLRGGAGVEVWDVSDPAARVLLGAATGSSDLYTSMGVSDGTALNTVRHYDGGGDNWYTLHAFDVSDPTSPQYGSFYYIGPYSVADAEVENGYGFVVQDGNSLAVFDVSDPYAISWVANVPTTQSFAWRVEVAAGFAYVTAGGLEIFDVSDPPATSSISYLPVPSAADVAVQGDLAYVGNGDELHVVDVSDRHAPSILGSVDLSSWLCESFGGFAVRGDFVYVPCGRSVGVVDVSVPEAPVMVGRFHGSVPRRIGLAAPGSDVVYLAGGNAVAPGDGGFPMWPQCGADATAAPVLEERAGGLSTWPNPFGALTTLDFDVARGGAVRLDVFDVRGRRVRTLLDRPLPAGPHRVGWNGRNGDGRALPAGIYFVRLTGGSRVETKKVVLHR